MRRVEIAMCLIRQNGCYLLQMRNGAQQVGGLNKVGCFGGKVEPGEAPEQAICREVAEESTLTLRTDEVTRLGEVDVVSDAHNEPIAVHAIVYVADIGDDVSVEAREGELVTMTTQEVLAHIDTLTPATRAVFEQIIKEE